MKLLASDNGYMSLLAAIYNQAIKDFSKCFEIKSSIGFSMLEESKRKTVYKTLAETKDFFYSDWGNSILSFLDIHSAPTKMIRKIKRKVWRKIKEGRDEQVNLFRTGNGKAVEQM